jgi:hypothetical protein
MKIYDDIDLLHHVAGADLFHVPFWLMMPHGSCVAWVELQPVLYGYIWLLMSHGRNG